MGLGRGIYFRYHLQISGCLGEVVIFQELGTLVASSFSKNLGVEEYDAIFIPPCAKQHIPLYTRFKSARSPAPYLTVERYRSV